MARKRGSGEGTIAKRSDGRYVAAAFVPVTGGGRRRVFVYGQTRDEVSDKLDDLRQAARDHMPRPLDGRPSVTTWTTSWRRWSSRNVGPRRTTATRSGAAAPQAGARSPEARRTGRRRRAAPAQGAAGEEDRRARWRAAHPVAAHGPVRARRSAERAVQRAPGGAGQPQRGEAGQDVDSGVRDRRQP